MPRTAVLLLHRGDPTSPAEAKGWLRELYADPKAVGIPFGPGAQSFLAGVMSRMDASGLSEQVAAAGGASIAAPHAQELARRLEAALGPDFVVRAGFGYAAPRLHDEVAALKAQGVERWVGLPLYPVFSERYTRPLTALLQKAVGEGPVVTWVDRYADSAPWLELARGVLRPLTDRNPQATVVFGALPVARGDANAGDSSPAAFEAHAQALMETNATPWRFAWLRDGCPGPTVEQLLAALKDKGVGTVILAPLGSVIDELATVHPLDVVARPLARTLGMQVERAPSPDASPQVAEALKAVVQAHLQRVAGHGFS